MKFLLKILPAFILAAMVMASCDEVSEPTVYDNWQPRNEAFIDSLKTLTGSSFVATIEQADAMPTGKLFAIEVSADKTDQNTYYVYCKKLISNNAGRRPLYTETVKTHYIGSYITGAAFDKTFDGYVATDQGNLDGTKKTPTAFDATRSFTVNEVISGWTTALQYMRTGERWMLYIPWECGYGSSSSSVLAYSALTFDVILKSVVNEE